MNKKGYEYSITGFVIALIVIGMLATTSALFMGAMQDEYGISGNSSLESYNKIANITSDLEDIQDQTQLNPKTGLLDIIGAFFSYGYAALKTSLNSVNIFNVLFQEAVINIPILGHINLFIVAIVLAIIFIGIVLSVLVKMRI